jgi:predicted  nucleic acid-binding Zn-ribbon protein
MESNDSEVIDVTPPKKRKGYGIQDAIHLMRTLPLDDNPHLVMTVIKNTLESAQVLVSDIIEDGEQRLQEIETRVTILKEEIVDFEGRIEDRRSEIARLEEDHAEVSAVKARLELVQGPPTHPEPELEEVEPISIE